MQRSQFLFLVISGISFTIILIFGIYFLVNYNVNAMNEMMGSPPSINNLIISLALFAAAISIALAMLLYFVHGKNQKRTEMNAASKINATKTDEQLLTRTGKLDNKDFDSQTTTALSNHLESDVLPNRIATGFMDLDALLYGGIPKHHAVALVSPPTDERELLIKRFLESGIASKEIVFDITTEVGDSEALAEKHSNFYLFVCNPQADAIISDSFNVIKLNGVDNLTDIDIAFIKAFRMLDSQEIDSKRMCIQIISDILLQHHAVTTRRWLSAFLPTLRSKGFTVLAVVDPQMHQSDELDAVLSVFDGEIRVNEKETVEGTEQTLKVRRLYNQKYQEREIIVTKEKLNQWRLKLP